MAREHYRHELDELLQDLLRLATQVELSVGQTTLVLETWDENLARTLIANDDTVDDAQHTINAQVLSVIARQAPVAGELRLVEGILALASELERISDHVENIAKMVVWEHAPPEVMLPDLLEMAQVMHGMLRAANRAFEQRDVAASHQVGAQDDAVDQLMRQVRQQTLALIVEDPANAATLLSAWYIALQYERIADRATNIAEQAIFVTTGDIVELNESRIPGQSSVQASDLVRPVSRVDSPPA